MPLSLAADRLGSWELGSGVSPSERSEHFDGALRYSRLHDYMVPVNKTMHQEWGRISWCSDRAVKDLISKLAWAAASDARSRL